MQALDFRLEVTHRISLIGGNGERVQCVLDIVAKGGEQAGGDSIALGSE